MPEYKIDDAAISEVVEQFRKELEKQDRDQGYFCSCWPCADKLLKVLIGLAGINPNLKKILTDIDKGLQKAYDAHCGQAR